MFRKLLFSALVITLLFTSTGFSQLEEANDNDKIGGESDMPSSWAEAYILNIKNSSEIAVEKLLSDYQENITRADFAYLGVKLYQYYTGREIMTGERYFTDTTDEWVLKARKAGIVDGYSDRTYRPNNFIRRDEIATLLVNVLEAAGVKFADASSDLFNDDSEIAGWAKESVYIAKANKIISGIGGNMFNPTGYATREQAIIMLSNAMREVQRNLSRHLRLGIDKIVLREVDSSIQNGIRVDKVDYPFEADDAALGQWVAIDLVENPLLFSPEAEHESFLFYDSVIFYQGGTFEYRSYYHYEGEAFVRKSNYRSKACTWTNGLVMQKYLHEQTSSRYFIATVNEEEYLFLEFKNGDYIYRNAAPKYYVFMRK